MNRPFFMRFFTREEEPKLWSLAVLTALALAMGAAMTFIFGVIRMPAVAMVADVYFAAAVIILVSSFFKQLQHNPYSYNTIYYAGFALVAMSILAALILLTVRMFREPGAYDIVHIARILMTSASDFMLLSAPFILVFSAALCISNISLIRHEGKRFVNILGIILSLIMVGGEVFLFFFDRYASGSLAQIRAHAFIAYLFAAAYLYFECMLIGTMIANIIVVRYEPDPDRDFVIILGCGMRQDGTAPPLLRSRIDRALAFREKQLKETGRDLTFITSGGQGPKEVCTESSCMKRYLIEQGVPSERIIEEDRSTCTYENMQFSKEKIMEAKPDGRAAFSTNNYHVFRSGIYAGWVKMPIPGMGAKTKWYFWPNASVREFIGILRDHRRVQLAIFLSMIAVYGVLTMIVYKG